MTTLEDIEKTISLEGSYNDHLVQLPDDCRADEVKVCCEGCCPNAHSTLTDVEHGPPLREFQGLTTLLVKKCFLMSSLNLPLCSFKPFPGTLSLDTREKSSAHLSPCPLLRKLQRAMRSLLSLLFSKLDKSRVLGHSSYDKPSSRKTDIPVFSADIVN